MKSLFEVTILFVSQALISILLWTHVAYNESSLFNFVSAIALVTSSISIFALVGVAVKLNFYIRERKALGLVGWYASLDLLNKYMGGSKPDDESFALLRSDADQAVR